MEMFNTVYATPLTAIQIYITTLCSNSHTRKAPYDFFIFKASFSVPSYDRSQTVHRQNVLSYTEPLINYERPLRETTSFDRSGVTAHQTQVQ